MSWMPDVEKKKQTPNPSSSRQSNRHLTGATETLSSLTFSAFGGHDFFL